MNDPGPADCACGSPLTDCRADGGEIVPPGYDYSPGSAKPHPGDPCPKLAMERVRLLMKLTITGDVAVGDPAPVLFVEAETGEPFNLLGLS